MLIASYFVLQSNKTNTEADAVLLIPELENQINDVEGIIISKNEQKINFTKTSGSWRIKEANNYLADARGYIQLSFEKRFLSLDN